eukprot:208370_1
MALRVSFATLCGLIMITSSSTIICDKSICDFGICEGDECHYNLYICSSSTSKCSLQCDGGCLNVTIQSSAQQTEVLCTQPSSCTSVSIQISHNNTQITPNTLLLSCYHSSACSNINIDCVDKPSCECHDVDGIQCTNNVNGNYITDELSTTQAPKEPKSMHWFSLYL